MKIVRCLFSVFILLVSSSVLFGADMATACKGLPDHAALTAALKKATGVGDSKANGGFALNMWATVVNRDGTVCAQCRRRGRAAVHHVEAGAGRARRDHAQGL